VYTGSQQGRQTQHQQNETTGETTEGQRDKGRRRRDNPDEDREQEPKEKREADRKEKTKGFEKKLFLFAYQKKNNRNQTATTCTDAHRERATETGIEGGNVKKMCSKGSRALGMQRAGRTEEKG
jgi:hypothetical protein